MAKKSIPFSQDPHEVRLTKDAVIGRMAEGLYLVQPEQWIPDATGYVLDNWQKQVFRKLFLGSDPKPGATMLDWGGNKKGKISVKASHSAGKTFTAGLLTHFFLSNFIPSKIAISGPCVEENEKILLADGRWVPVKELSGRYFGVLSPQQDLSVSYQLASAFPNGVKPVFELMTRSGRKAIRTSNHPFLTLDGWKKLEDIQIGEFVGIPTELPAYGKREMPEHEVKLLAYMVAEGNTTDLAYGQATFAQNNDTEVQREFYDCIDMLGGCRAYYRGERSHVVVGTVKSEGGRGINPFKDWCRKYGMEGRYSWLKQIPPPVFELSNDLVRIFLSRLFAGDGYVRGGDGNDLKEIGYCTTSRELIDDVNRLVLRFGIAGRIRTRKYNKYLAYSLNKRDLYHWYVIGRDADRFAREIGVFSKEKAIDGLLKRQTNARAKSSLLDTFPSQIAREISNKIKGMGNQFRREVGLSSSFGNRDSNISRPILKNIAEKLNSKRLLDLAQAKVAWDEVVDIAYLGDRMTYGIEVPGPESYITDFIEHNTGKQTRSQVWSVIAQIWNRSVFKDDLDWFRTKMAFKASPEEWFAIWLTSKEPKSIEGFHGPDEGKNLLWIIEESKGVEDKVFEAIQGALSCEQNYWYISSTCGIAHGFFFDTFHSQKELWENVSVPYYESSRISPEQVRIWKKTWGEDSSIFRARVMAEFPEESDKIIVPNSWYLRAVVRNDDDDDMDDAA